MTKFKYPCFQALDIFGVPPLFTIRGRATFQTQIGSSLTIVCATLILTYILFFIDEMINHKSPNLNSITYYDETPYDYYGGFVTIDEDPYNTVGENSINIANLYLEGSNLVGYYDLDKDSVYIAAWQTIGVSGEYGLITVNWKDTKSDWIPFSINKDGSLTSDRFGVYSYDADFVEQKGWWEAATIATLTPTNSASSRRTSAKRSVTTKIMKIDKGHLSNKRIKK